MLGNQTVLRCDISSTFLKCARAYVPASLWIPTCLPADPKVLPVCRRACAYLRVVIKVILQVPLMIDAVRPTELPSMLVV